VDWIDVAQDRDQWSPLVNTVMNLRVIYDAGKILSGCTIGGFSRKDQLREFKKNIKEEFMFCLLFSEMHME
jgi:hypothetical protein